MSKQQDRVELRLIQLLPHERSRSNNNNEYWNKQICTQTLLLDVFCFSLFVTCWNWRWCVWGRVWRHIYVTFLMTNYYGAGKCKLSKKNKKTFLSRHMKTECAAGKCGPSRNCVTEWRTDDGQSGHHIRTPEQSNDDDDDDENPRWLKRWYTFIDKNGCWSLWLYFGAV